MKSTRVLEVGPGDDACLSQADLVALSGGVVSPAAPEAPDGHAGAVFVLGSAFGSPGGSPMVGQPRNSGRGPGGLAVCRRTGTWGHAGLGLIAGSEAIGRMGCWNQLQTAPRPPRAVRL
ncbi:hypothetical protein PLESTF_001459900 [Pleodorina starrii]|nr:hypothetical protein PLESTF_001459900 [Pleodorina starrii]